MGHRPAAGAPGTRGGRRPLAVGRTVARRVELALAARTGRTRHRGAEGRAESPPDQLIEQPRLIKLADAPQENLNEEVLVLVGADGTMEAIKNLAARKAAGFDRQVAKLGRPRLGLPRPDDRPVKLVLSGLLRLLHADQLHAGPLCPRRGIVGHRAVARLSLPAQCSCV